MVLGTAWYPVLVPAGARGLAGVGGSEVCSGTAPAAAPLGVIWGSCRPTALALLCRGLELSLLPSCLVILGTNRKHGQASELVARLHAAFGSF